MGNLAQVLETKENQIQTKYCVKIFKNLSRLQKTRPKPLILIVEDDRLTRKFLTTVLQRCMTDYRVISVKNYDKGEIVIEKLGYFVEKMLIDNRLGQGENKRGINLVEYAKQLYPKINAISMTNNPEDIIGTRYESLFDTILPVNSKTEIALIRKSLETRIEY